MKRLPLVFLLTLSAAAQTTAATTVPPKNYKADCSTMGVAPGCQSYNKLVQSKDKDILDLVTTGYAVVCFREKEDIFTIVSFEQPIDGQFAKDPKTSLLSAFGMLFFHRFSGGLSDDSKWLIGKWNRLSLISDPSFVSHDEANSLDGSVDSTEINISYPFTNLNHTKTDYSFQVRRSTLRFNETWQFKDDQKTTSSTRTSSSGHCASFN